MNHKDAMKSRSGLGSRESHDTSFDKRMEEIRMLRDRVNEAMELLEDREQQIIRMRYGLDGMRRFTLKEIGKRYEITAERVRQIQAHAMRKLLKKIDYSKIKDIPLTFE